jgi:hypothetical protein
MCLVKGVKCVHLRGDLQLVSTFHVDRSYQSLLSFNIIRTLCHAHATAKHTCDQGWKPADAAAANACDLAHAYLWDDGHLAAQLLQPQAPDVHTINEN